MKLAALIIAASMIIGSGAISTADAAELQFTVVYGENDPGTVETFDVNTSIMGMPSQTSAELLGSSQDADFMITDDSLGNKLLQVGDSGDSNYFATGVSDEDAFATSPTFTGYTSEQFYNGSSLFLQATTGETATGVDGTIITITPALVSGAPEPSTWALMIAGVAMIGGALQLGRRRDDMIVKAVS